MYVNGIDKVWAADLVEMQSFSKFNRGVRYLLTVIDVFSKYGWMLPLKDKTGKSVADTFKRFSKNYSENQKSFGQTKFERFTTKI